MTGCRIGKVKLKSGGIIHRLPTVERDEPQKLIVDRAAKIAGFYKPGEMHGYVVFAWDKDGYSSVGYFINHDGFIGCRILPSFISDALREKMIEQGDWGQR
jgi:hypothetical protein